MADRISKIISAHGLASRREAERMISRGDVTVNGEVAILGQSADVSCDVIAVNGVELKAKDAPVYIMLNKPCGYLSTARDERGRKTILELVSDVGVRVYPVGRLDLDSEGLILLTNDGEFANNVAHPSGEKVKTYRVEVVGDISEAYKQLGAPIEIDGYTVSAVNVKILSHKGDRGVLSISIAEGRNRQIRKMCSVCRLKVFSLRRVSIGELELGALESGKWRYLTDSEVASLGG
ncbi:MAG: rRNA pseudouridine synthase [Oscillospiraceae bacterium]|nr:rRNA pseudouridine synthase [Oscillospiraceae bacterium]